MASNRLDRLKIKEDNDAGVSGCLSGQLKLMTPEFGNMATRLGKLVDRADVKSRYFRIYENLNGSVGAGLDPVIAATAIEILQSNDKPKERYLQLADLLWPLIVDNQEWFDVDKFQYQLYVNQPRTRGLALAMRQVVLDNRRFFKSLSGSDVDYLAMFEIRETPITFGAGRE
jgi:hypothetical protein